jgi:hypothetical protein
MRRSRVIVLSAVYCLTQPRYAEDRQTADEGWQWACQFGKWPRAEKAGRGNLGGPGAEKLGIPAILESESSQDMVRPAGTVSAGQERGGS